MEGLATGHPPEWTAAIWCAAAEVTTLTKRRSKNAASANSTGAVTSNAKLASKPSTSTRANKSTRERETKEARAAPGILKDSSGLVGHFYDFLRIFLGNFIFADSVEYHVSSVLVSIIRSLVNFAFFKIFYPRLRFSFQCNNVDVYYITWSMSVSEFLSLVLFHFILSCIFFLGKSSFLPILALCVCACVCFPIFNFSSKTKKNCNRIHRIVFFSSLFPIKTSKWIIIIINIIIILKETKKIPQKTII